MYELTAGGEFVGKLYVGSNCSFMQAPGRVVRIDYVRHFFKTDKYYMTDHLTGEQIGRFDFHDSFWHTEEIANIYFATTAFVFSRNKSDISWKTPSSWSLVRYDMSSPDVEISYFLRDLKITRIGSPKDDEWIEILAGLFVIGHLARQTRENR